MSGSFLSFFVSVGLSGINSSSLLSLSSATGVAIGSRIPEEDELEEAGCDGGGDGESVAFAGVPAMMSGELPVPELLL